MRLSNKKTIIKGNTCRLSLILSFLFLYSIVKAKCYDFNFPSDIFLRESLHTKV